MTCASRRGCTGDYTRTHIRPTGNGFFSPPPHRQTLKNARFFYFIFIYFFFFFYERRRPTNPSQSRRDCPPPDEKKKKTVKTSVVTQYYYISTQPSSRQFLHGDYNNYEPTISSRARRVTAYCARTPVGYFSRVCNFHPDPAEHHPNVPRNSGR